jgi:tetratricopeptide (TPR) repeat protein
MTEELLNVLARLPKLKVAARTSVFEFKGKGGDVREIGRKLGVSHIVEGSVRREDEQVRVTAQLIRVADGFHVWSESYDRELESVFALQDDIARHIAEQLQSALGVAELPAARAAIDPLAYDEYLKGRTLHRRRKDFPTAIAHLQAAVARAPEFAAGWASLSLAHDAALWYTTSDQRSVLGDALANMRIAAERAADLDPDAALTLHAQANVARGEARYTEAEALYLRAIQADPTYPDVREDYAELLNSVGRHEDSLIATRQLLELEPFVAVFWWRLAAIGTIEDRRELVDEARERMRVIDPAAQFGVMADYYLEFWQGRIEPARAELAEAMRFAPIASAQDAELFQWSERKPGVDDAQARRTILARPDYSAYAVHRGDADLFFAVFEDEQARALRYNFYTFIAMPVAQPLLADPRTKEMMNRYGYVAYWQEKGWPALCRPLGSDDFECGPAARKD